MTTQERFRRIYNHQEADRVPVMDSPWGETIARWQSEGMPSGDWVGYFGLDRIAGFGTDNTPRFPTEVIEENERFRIATNAWGMTTKSFKGKSATSEIIDFKINSYDAWLKCKDRIQPSDDRIPWQMLKDNYKTWKDEGRWISGGLWFGFDITHSYAIGTENCLMAMYEEPEWIKDMFETELNASLAMLEKIWDAGYTFDEVSWPDDMGYKGTTFFSLDMYRDILKPLQKRAVDWAHEHGCVVRLHSCGDIMTFVPDLVEIGIDCLNPLEVKAGMDPFYLKDTYGDRLTLHGGINAAHWNDTDLIISEIEETMPKLMKNGGYIFASDHSIPPMISFPDFCRVMKRVLELGKY